jgi:hypothetical protein
MTDREGKPNDAGSLPVEAAPVPLTVSELARRVGIPVKQVRDALVDDLAAGVSLSNAGVVAAGEGSRERAISALERIADAAEQLAHREHVGGDDGPARRLRRPPGPGEPAAETPDRLAGVEAQVGEILEILRKRPCDEPERAAYTVKEVADRTTYKAWTIRNACNTGRIRAEKGGDGNWRIPHEELVNIQNNGLPRRPSED